MPPLLCVYAVPDAGCHLTPLRDTVGCSPDDNALTTCPDYASDFAPATLRSFSPALRPLSVGSHDLIQRIISV